MDETLYGTYLERLLAGDTAACSRIVSDLLARDIGIRELYVGLFQRSLYEVGALWEANKISVSREHLVTAITDRLMGLAYPKLFEKERPAHALKAVVSCTCNEHHQIGGKMVADLLELNGFDTHFLGANVPADQLLRHLGETRSEVVGLSLSVYFNFPELTETIERIMAHFADTDILVGGQAFRWGGADRIARYPNATYVPSLSALELLVRERYL